MTYMLLLNCALKLAEEMILYYDARSKKHQIITLLTQLAVYGFITHFIYTATHNGTYNIKIVTICAMT